MRKQRRHGSFRLMLANGLSLARPWPQRSWSNDGEMERSKMSGMSCAAGRESALFTDRIPVRLSRNGLLEAVGRS
jgi:hypothetical protein